MPTGFTTALYDGEDQTFEQFALTCARNFGALVEMRDMALDATIPDEFTPSPYHVDLLAEANARLLTLEAMTLVECVVAASRDLAAWRTDRAAQQAKASARAERYRAMLGEVLRWTPPSDDHVGLRDFMVSQLEESIRFDGPSDDTTWNPAPDSDGVSWRERHVAKALRDIAYHAEELAKDKERARERTVWLRDLRRSLAPVEVPA